MDALEASQEYGAGTKFFLFDDGSCDGTLEILMASNLPKMVITHKENIGLRNTIIEFFDIVRDRKFDYLIKMDNDCEVPKNWINELVQIMHSTNADIISPNVLPSNAAFEHGEEDIHGLGYRSSQAVGGLWCMKKSMIEGLYFEKAGFGIRGAFNILKQIILEKEPKIGWTEKVTVQDIGHWSGEHPKHIKNESHAQYSAHVGRSIVWS
jgi:glycosyltransferase involved in cell wall biosynthesis